MRGGLCWWPEWAIKPVRLEYKAIRYCGAPAIEGRSYCPAHAARASRRDEVREIKPVATKEVPILIADD